MESVAKSPDDLSNSTILIVDDEPNLLKALVRILNFYGYNIISAFDGKEAMKIVQNTDVDLILLDVFMPALNGYQVCEKLKSNASTSKIPVIFLTGLTDTDSKIKGLEAGGVDYIFKPFVPQEVVLRVQTHLKLKKTQDRLNQYNAQLEQILAERTRTLIKTERQAAISLSIQGIVHNLKNPLSCIIGAASLLSFQLSKNQQVSVEKCSNNLSIIEHSGEKMLNMINSMMVKSRNDKSENIQVVDLNELIKQELDYIDGDKQSSCLYNIIHRLSDSVLPVNVLSAEISQVFHNLVKNAMDALVNQETPTIIIESGSFADYNWFSITDNGPGIPEDIQTRIFEPFFTTKAKEDDNNNLPKGTGLGLYTCWDIVNYFRGFLEMKSQPGYGASFLVKLPAAIKENE